MDFEEYGLEEYGSGSGSGKNNDLRHKQHTNSVVSDSVVYSVGENAPKGRL
jgi:hypothetical protein